MRSHDASGLTFSRGELQVLVILLVNVNMGPYMEDLRKEHRTFFNFFRVCYVTTVWKLHLLMELYGLCS
jgi:hypothetical protein